MKGTLILRFSAFMQAWGTQPSMNTFSTLLRPSKSGVIGLLANALGRKRYESIEDLCRSLRMGIRVDQPGRVIRDFQTVHFGLQPWEAKEDRSFLTRRQYLCGAVFVIGLEGEMELLNHLQKAIQHPAHILYLGRKSCLPDSPLCLFPAPFEASLEDALSFVPFQGSERPKKRKSGSAPDLLDLWLEGTEGRLISFEKETAVSFDPKHRQYDLCPFSLCHVRKDSFAASLTSWIAAHDPFDQKEGMPA